ncbi:MAG: methyltransferase domain-containing protein [Bacteroidales bacterium]
MFDEIAKTYDETFTSTRVGKMLREMVWEYFYEILPQNTALNILELNCGTGEDAIYFAKMGHRVTATDLSEQMIEVFNEKIKNSEFDSMIRARTCDFRNILDIEHPEKYDLVFSNFGGLNCVDTHDLKNLSSDLNRILNPNARFIAVVMTRFCLWESLYFLAKINFANAFRRNTSKSLEVKLGNNIVNTWYYSPANWDLIFGKYFEKINMRPIGFFLPPSYLDPFFVNKPALLSNLFSLDKKVFKIPSLAYISDHFLMDMKMRPRS